ncbi:MAG TPA: iron-containing redox enzyme family protein [Candidatus Binatia bacterium]|nr:iron-containing redox enzyme family protein [Candidatus Binatia bacterium]
METAASAPRPLRAAIEAGFEKQVVDFVGSPEFQALERGGASRAEYDRFIENVVRAHLRSPQLLAFLYSVAPPAAAPNLLHNMLEELGIEEEDGTAHPSLLRELAAGAGLTHRLPDLERLADADIKRVVVAPILYGTLKEFGLAALAEIVAFEYMLSRVAGRVARALATHCGLSPEALAWFTHHSEVDIRHAEQGLDDLEHYIAYYDFAPDEAMTIIEMALRENVFIKRYFGAEALARATGMTDA